MEERTSSHNFFLGTSNIMKTICGLNRNPPTEYEFDWLYAKIPYSEYLLSSFPGYTLKCGVFNT